LIVARVLALVLVLLAGAAQAREPVGVEVFQYGIFRADIVGRQRDVGGLAHNVVDNICHIATTLTVPMRIGLHFGVRYKVTGPVDGERVLLTKVMRFPTLMTPPAPAQPMSQVLGFVELAVGASSYTDYAFEQTWELAAGTWTFEFHARGQKLAEFSFTVVEDAGGPLPGAAEATCFQIS
jgi:hypothetical protein